MTATIIKWVIIAVAAVNFGYMVFDGTRALTVGDYLRPKTGEYAGELGPWSKIVNAVGINPESTLMKVIFVVWGLTGLFLTICFLMNLGWAWTGLLIISIGTLWYLIPGTALSILVIILLLIMQYQKRYLSGFDRSFTSAIVKELKIKLNRDLTTVEMNAFTSKRSGIAYEMMMDYISDDRKSKDEIENYVKEVVDESNES